MPKFPATSARLDQISGSVYEKFLPKMREKGDDLVKLHIGDSYLPPTYPIPIDKQFTDNHSDFNRYCNTMGVYPLRQALAEKVVEDNNLPADSDNVMLTAGASNALNVSMMSLINPGEEVLVLTPCWPFILGMVRIAGGSAVEVPFYTALYENPNLNITTYLEPFISKKTIAIYLNSPNNPSGKVLNKNQLEAVAKLAKRHHLWLISDEAYDGMTYDNRPHYSPGSFPGMFDQTLSIFTFSKVYMFAGLRLGYIVTNAKVLRSFNKMLVHQLYSPSPMAQYMMIDPVKTRKEWGKFFVEHCHELRDIFTQGLNASYNEAEGAYYVFFSVESLLGKRNYWDIIDACLESGVSVAPGQDFGKDYANYIRLCFGGESPERLKVAVERLNRVLDAK